MVGSTCSTPGWPTASERGGQLALPSPGLPGQPMYYVIPSKAANATLASSSTSRRPRDPGRRDREEVQLVSGHRSPHVQSKLAPADWNKLFTDIKPQDLAQYAGRSAVGVLHRHRGRVRASGAEVTPHRRPVGPTRRRGPRLNHADPSRTLGPACARAKATAAAFATDNALGLLLVAPALSIVALFFARRSASRHRCVPGPRATATLANVAKAYELYSTDFLFTVAIVALSSALMRRSRSRSPAI